MTDDSFIASDSVLDRQHCWHRPRLEQRLPQYQVASFPAITPVALSRIRRLES